LANQTLVLFGTTYWHDDLQICLTRERERFVMPLHKHDFVEVSWIAQGKGYQYIDDERLSVEKDDLFILPVGTCHVYRPSSESRKDDIIVYNCLFSTEIAERLLAPFPRIGQAAVLFQREKRAYMKLRDDTGHVGQLIESMYEEFCLKMEGYDTLLQGMLVQLLALFYRIHGRQAGETAVLSPMDRVLRHINTYYREKIYVKDLAMLIPVSESHFQRMFYQSTGQSLTEYIQNKRIYKCCELLITTDWSVSAIAGHVGYKDMQFFNMLFRKKRGLTPFQYRKQHWRSV